MAFIVAIDGPAGSGKGSVTKLIAQKLGLINIDTGAIYRSVALATLRNNIKLEEVDKILELLKKINIEIQYKENTQYTFLDGEDVSREIREKEVTDIVSFISTPPKIREEVTKLERKVGNDNLMQGKSIIMEGRDITTVVFPSADVKIYLDASPEERAKRRYNQNKEAGIDIPFEDILENIKTRDYNDMHKTVGALKKADDAICFDCSNMTAEETAEELCKIIKEKIV